MTNNQPEKAVEEIEAGLSESPYVRSHILINRSSGEGRDIPVATGNYLKRFSAEKTERRASNNKEGSRSGGSSVTGQAVMPGFTAEAVTPDDSPRPGREVRYYKAEVLPVNVRSDRLRRIADTAFYDIRAEMENQLTFPQAEDAPAPQTQDTAGKKTIVSAGELLSAVPEVPETKPGVRTRITSFASRLRQSGKASHAPERKAEVPCADRDEIPQAVQFFIKRRRRSAVKIIVLAVLFLLTAGLSAAYALSQRGSAYFSTGLYAVISFIFSAGAAAACSADILTGAKALFSGSFTSEAGIPLLFIAALLQSGALFFAPDGSVAGSSLVAPAVIFVMIVFSAGESLRDEQSVRILTRVRKGGMLLFKRADRPGIEAGMSERYAEKGKYLSYGKKTDYIDDPASVAANAVPESVRNGAVNIFAFILAVAGGVISGMYASSFTAGVTVAGALLCTGLPVLSRLTPTIKLLSANKDLEKKRSAVFTYSDAAAADGTASVAIGESALVDPDGCIIHNIKGVNNADVRRAMILCAAALKACGSPLSNSAANQAGVSPEKLPACVDIRFHDEGCVMTCEGHRLFIGSERLMSDNAVQIPLSLDYFDIITGDRRLLFFALDKKIALVLSVSYHIRMSAKNAVYELAKSGRRVASAVFDPNITPEMIASRARVKNEDVSRMRVEEANYIRRSAGRAVGSSGSAVIWDGTAEGLSAVLGACGKLARVIPVSTAAGIVASILLSAGVFAVSLIFGPYAAVIAAPAAVILCRVAESAAVGIFT